MRFSNVACLVLGLTASTALAAQPSCVSSDAGSLRWMGRLLSGRTARIELADGKVYSRAREVSVGPETVSGLLRGERFEVPAAEVHRIETLAKRQPLGRFLRGLAIGTGVGALVYFSGRNNEVTDFSASIIGSGAAIGGTIGGIVGLAAPALDGETVCESASPGG
jgi:hypothetical protein